MDSIEWALELSNKLVINPTPLTVTEYIDAYGAIYNASVEYPLGVIVRGIKEMCDGAPLTPSLHGRCRNLLQWCGQIAA